MRLIVARTLGKKLDVVVFGSIGPAYACCNASISYTDLKECGRVLELGSS